MSNTKNVTSKQEVKSLVAGIDVGNGYVKANVGGKPRVFPSIMVKQFNVALHTPLGVNDLPNFMRDIENNMDISFTSPLVESTERRLFGERALKSGLNLEEFDVFSRQSKAEVDLSGGLALATIAADQLERFYNSYKSLPTSGIIETTVNLATALPISEHQGHAKGYRDRYMNNGNSHTVTFHNFERLVKVEITFKNVFISSEGESAQYGLIYAKDGFLDMIYNEATKRYPELEEMGIKGEDLVGSKNTLGIDIGEGTIDFAVFTNGRFNSDASSTFNQGYGTILESTLSTLIAKGQPYKSRKELSEFIHSVPNPLSKPNWTNVKEINQTEENRFGDVISSEVSKVYSRVGAFVEVIFVYGGGATPLEWTLFDKLQSRVKEFGQSLIPIVYLDSVYSRFLNVQGLYQVALRLEKVNK